MFDLDCFRSSTAGLTTTTYGYTSGTNRLASITQGTTTSVSTNANGNITSIPPANSATAATFAYNVTNRLASVTGTSPAPSFVYDAFGQRYSKTDSGSPITYRYDFEGKLLEENNSGQVTDYIYSDGRLFALFTPATGAVYYVHSDRQGTPQLVTDSLQAPVWGTSYQPYGATPAIISGIVQNLRFPGQYFDLETGFSYNLNRDYMPNLGRYLESDPIGLGGGINTFAYAKNNPGKFTDRLGLQEVEEERDPREEETEQENEILRTEFNAARQELRSINPNNPQLTFITSPGWTPNEQDVENMQTALQAARTNQCPPLQRLHPESTITNNLNRSSYDYWSRQSTEEIIRSLRPGNGNLSLTVDPTGTIFQGNTRILILEQRGVEINGFPREAK